MSSKSEEAAQKAAVEARKKARLAKKAAESNADVAGQKAGVEARKQERLAKKAAEDAVEARRERAVKAAERKSESAVNKAQAESKARMAKAAVAKAAAEALRSYTVKAGDTLGAISQAMLGNANRYNEIFELNKDILPSASAIQVGQTLKIPAE